MAGTTTTNYCQGHERLGEAGLALHYANIINQINMIVCIMLNTILMTLQIEIFLIK